MIYVEIEKKLYVMKNYTNRKKNNISIKLVIITFFIDCNYLLFIWRISQVIFLQKNTLCDLYKFITAAK